MFRRVAAWCVSLIRRPIGSGPPPVLEPEQSLELLRRQIEERRHLVVNRPEEARDTSVTAGLRVFLVLELGGLALAQGIYIAALLGRSPTTGIMAGLMLGVLVGKGVIWRVLGSPEPDRKRKGQEAPTLGDPLARVFLVLELGGLALAQGIYVAALLGRWPTRGIIVGLMLGALVGKGVIWRVPGSPEPDRKRKGQEVLTLGDPLASTPMMICCFSVYVVVNVALFFVITGLRGTWSEASGDPAVCGLLMVFYAALAAEMYAVIVAAEQGPPRHCANRHPVLPWATSCPRCGAPVAEPGSTVSTGTLPSPPLAGDERGDSAMTRHPTEGWPFDDPRDVTTLTVRQILHGGQPILRVFHDPGGLWQFLPGDSVERADALSVTLGEVFRLDPSIAELADLPLGGQASRRAAGEPWQRRADG